MKILLHRTSIELEPEGELEWAFLEDTLGLKDRGATLRVGGRTTYHDGRQTISLERGIYRRPETQQ